MSNEESGQEYRAPYFKMVDDPNEKAVRDTGIYLQPILKYLDSAESLQRAGVKILLHGEVVDTPEAISYYQDSDKVQYVFNQGEHDPMFIRYKNGHEILFSGDAYKQILDSLRKK